MRAFSKRTTIAYVPSFKVKPSTSLLSVRSLASARPPRSTALRHVPVVRLSIPRLARCHSTGKRLAQSTASKALQSSSSPLFYIIPLIAGAIVLYSAGIHWTGPAEADLPTSEKTPRDLAVDGLVFEAMSIPPGRLGNLTPEQEEKLFELWKLIFQVCGVEDDGISEAAADGASTSLQAQTSTASSEKPKKDKKRLGLFKKKDKKDKENGAEKASGSLDTIKDHDPDDKYGQNKMFQETLANRSPESIRASLWTMVKMDHPDQLVLRFLRARKWDVQKALIMLVSTMKWRQDAKVDEDIMLHGEEHFFLQEQSGATEKDKKFAKDFLDQMRMGKSFSHGIDKDGRPATVVRTRLHRAGEQSEESLERYTIYLIETNRHLLSAPVDTGTVIFDMTGFSMANMDYTPVKFMIQCFEANYPESLGVVLVHKAPWVFQGFWKIIKGWLDPVVASKVHFTNNLKDMSEFITPSRIPKELDGEDSWEYHYVEPVIGENQKLKDTETRDKMLEEREVFYDEYEQATLHWLREKDAAKRTAVQAERNEIARKLKDGYWALDPYVRSRSLYDRVGILHEGGKLDYYAWNKAPSTGAVATSVETAADDVD
ncbi:hypothetical protein PFICI_05919 [Pestalotiopsis fici W106-1]|uniref:CRAL-TRIO domain-containing protein n=1 Tax=Pestalotiopsis fici (strain W106-1 / CGMCC3.15140) TaxID=1229662 RepID=W3XD70_PESFW|nr:uncharacterized protein PFICI_05919 [Pestalotiopsis fici W106-1]ETS84043.1 hypothetical protein PFICI_05919 [Pestalotiopsis fici W106-1]